MRFRAIITLLLLACQAVAWGQSRVRFVESDALRMPLLSRTVSIDGVRDSVYTAYGSPRELAALAALGYRYETLEEPAAKGLAMATTLEQMDTWDRYPTYGVYLQMMRRFADDYPDLCRLDTIGRSVEGRLILCVRLTSQALPDSLKPQFLYSSTIHGDELTGFHLMLRLVDTLLAGYGRNAEYTDILDSIQVFINPLSNPDGTYHGGDDGVDHSQRYNALLVDLNRNYPDPFGHAAPDTLQPENQAMIAYVGRHRFRIAANLHGGAEVLNYPWDSFRSSERSHPDEEWWKKVCRKFIDTLRDGQDEVAFADVRQSGYVAGGDWYVIPNGRQDYMNATQGVLEMTIELSTTKKLPGHQLPTWWRALQRPLVGYIHACTLDTTFVPQPAADTAAAPADRLAAHPNPASGVVTLELGPSPDPIHIYYSDGRLAATHHPAPTARSIVLDLRALPAGIYLLRRGSATARLVVAR